METGIVKYLSEVFEVNIPTDSSRDQLQLLLAEKINYLIINDFSLLVHILYRIDVSEQKLKNLLKENSQADAGKIISTLIIERQLQKIRSRQQNGRDGNDMNNDLNERW